MMKNKFTEYLINFNEDKKYFTNSVDAYNNKWFKKDKRCNC